jgi:hypothetical protein
VRAISYPAKVEDFPTGKNYAIFNNSSYTSPGYDAHETSYTSPYVTIELFATEADWKAEIESRMKNPHLSKGFKAAIITIPDVKVTISVEVL